MESDILITSSLLSQELNIPFHFFRYRLIFLAMFCGSQGMSFRFLRPDSICMLSYLMCSWPSLVSGDIQLLFLHGLASCSLGKLTPYFPAAVLFCRLHQGFLHRQPHYHVNKDSFTYSFLIGMLPFLCLPDWIGWNSNSILDRSGGGHIAVLSLILRAALSLPTRGALFRRRKATSINRLLRGFFFFF